MALLKRCLLALAIGCGILCICLLIDWQRDNARLRIFAGGMLDILDTRSVTGGDVVTGSEIERLNAKISRLLVAVLREFGVAATSVMLAPCDGCEFVHTVVEAKAVDGRIVVDPSYAMSFPKSKGGYYSVRDLRKDSSIIVERLEEMNKFLESGNQLAFDRARFE